jgi:hypothetical protein
MQALVARRELGVGKEEDWDDGREDMAETGGCE